MEKVRIYFDEDIRPILAEILRDRGYDVVSSVEKRIFGLTDEEQLDIAIKDKRAILTHNIKDFVQLHHKRKEAHFGIIVSDQIPLTFLLRRLLKLLATAYSENLKGQLIWLSKYK